MSTPIEVDFVGTITVNDEVISDWRSFESGSHLGFAEPFFVIDIDRPLDISTGGYASISYTLNNGSPYALLNKKLIEVIDKGTTSISLRGSGSLLSRRGPFRSVYFINETWLRTMFPTYYLKNGIIYVSDPGSKPLQFKGVSVNRLFIPQLPGKDVKDIEFECVVKPGLSYLDIAQYIKLRTGYALNISVPPLYVQKTFVIGAEETWFSALARLYSIFNPMMFIDNGVLNVLDVAGDATTDTGPCINFTEDSFSVIKYNVDDSLQVVDHLVIQGPTSNFIYNYMQGGLSAKIKRSALTLPGTSLTIVDERDYAQESSEYLGVLEAELAAQGVTLSLNEVFEYVNSSADKNGREATTTEYKINTLTGETATISETIETWNVGGNLVHKVQTTTDWADYHTPVRTIIREWARLGVLECDVTEQNIGGMKNIIPQQYEFRLLSMRSIVYGAYIGDPNKRDVDIDECHLVAYLLDTDTIGDTDVYVQQRPQIVTRNSMIGVTPSTWEPSDDNNTGSRYKFIPTRRERIRYDAKSRFLLKKTRQIEEFLPLYTNDIKTENIFIGRVEPSQDLVQTKWEYFLVDGVIHEYTGGQPPIGLGVDPTSGLPIGFHPKVTLSCPDLVDSNRAYRIAKAFFKKHTQQNTSASIRTTIPVPGIKVGHVVNLPTCTKQYLDGTAWQTANIAGGKLWVVGVRTRGAYSGSPGASHHDVEAYTEIDLKKNY